MTNKPFFSIVIPTFNREKDLQFALHCLLKQSFSNFEIIVSDNCSTDDTEKVAKQFVDKRIRYFKNRKNLGSIPNVKKAISHALGEYIFLHGDDDFLIYKQSLQEIYLKLIKHHPGLIRVNYLCYTPDKKRIFNFELTKTINDNKYIPPASDAEKILSFIRGIDTSFMTGIIFKNATPSNIKIITGDVAPWIKILFYVTKKYGAYYIEKPYFIASWSDWRMKGDDSHPLYSLPNGRLASEDYLSVIKEELSPEAYGKFLHNWIMSYVFIFPAIKFYVGNANLIRLSRRLKTLDSTVNKNLIFWIYIIFSLVMPRLLLGFARILYLFFYVRLSKVNDKQIINKVKELEQNYEVVKKD